MPGVGAAVRAPAETDGAVWQYDLAARVERDRLPLRVVGLAELAVEVGRAHVSIRHHDGLAAFLPVFLQHDQHRQVGVSTGVVVEVGAASGEIELLQDDVTHRHCHRGVGPLLRVQPKVGELRHLGIIGRDRDRLGALVSDFGEEVRIGRARLRHVRTPGNDESGVVPIGGLRHVGLLAPDLRARRRQVAVPVVEAHADATKEAHVSATGGVTDHRHRRYRGKADDAIRAVLLDRVDVRCGDDLVDFVPARADEAAKAAHALVIAPRGVVPGDGRPRVDGVVRHARRAPAFEQASAHHRILDAIGAVQIPAVRRSARAAPRLVIRHVPARTRIVGLLGFPGDDAALDVDLPRARAGAVDAVGRAHHLVVRPAIAVGILPSAVLAGGNPVTVGEFLLRVPEIIQSIEEMAHR